MGTANPFLEWLAEVAADAVVVRPADAIAEARGNLWAFGLDDEQRAAVTPAAVEEFVRAVAAARSRWLADRGVGPMRFYCWHDAQADQLRFSLVSAGGAGLPFGLPVEPASALDSVVRDFLQADATAPRSAPAGLGHGRPVKRFGRVFFYNRPNRRIMMLHAFMKKSAKTPAKELKIARERMSEVQSHDDA